MILSEEIVRQYEGFESEIVDAIDCMPEIPDAEYVVVGQNVFVRARLLELVVAKLEKAPDTSIESLALEQFNRSVISPLDAVTKYGIKPLHYSLEEQANRWWVVHQVLDARLAAEFGTRDDALDALAKVLVGTGVPGRGEFCHDGQAFILLQPLRVTLTARPSLPVMVHSDAPAFAWLSDSRFVAGVPALSELAFRRIRNAEVEWSTTRTAISGEVRARARDLRCLVAHQPFRFPTVCSPGGLSDVAVGRELFPELTGVPSNWMGKLIRDFQYAHGWTGDVDHNEGIDFLCYVLGTQVNLRPELKGMSLLAGEFVAFGLISNKPFHEAVELALHCLEYHSQLSCVACRVAQVLGVLSEPAPVQRRGRRVQTAVQS